MDIHDRIKQKRLEKGMSMQELATACGLKGYQAVQQWEKSDGTAPTRTRMPRVAEALGVSQEWLQFGVETTDDPIWPLSKWVSRARFDALPPDEKARAGRLVLDTVETWEKQNRSELKKVG
ncbi:putative HTH-type transcriptional regulator SinR [Pararobbsia alpina]